MGIIIAIFIIYFLCLTWALIDDYKYMKFKKSMNADILFPEKLSTKVSFQNISEFPIHIYCEKLSLNAVIPQNSKVEFELEKFKENEEYEIECFFEGAEEALKQIYKY